nr:MAG TPA: hypothetical protein [Caudoviricetes sp.]
MGRSKPQYCNATIYSDFSLFLLLSLPKGSLLR